jgi:HEAT repeat protein
MVPPSDEFQAERERIHAVEAFLGRSDDEALSALLDASREDSWRVRERAVRQLTLFPSHVLVRCVRETVEGAREPAVRNAAMDALVRQGDEAVDHVFTLLAHENWELRLHGAVVLGNIRSGRAVDRLAALLTDTAENVVHAAAESLGAIGDPRAVPYLVDVLRTQEFWSQYPTVVALGRIAHHSATEALLEYLEDEMLAPAIADALGAIGDPRALQPLLHLLEAEEPLVPFSQLLRALVRIRSAAGAENAFPESLRAASVRAVEQTLASQEVEDRIAALIFAGWAAAPELIPFVAPRLAFDAEQEAAHTALLSIGAAAGPQLLALLDSPAPGVRRSAIRLLGELGHDLEIVLRHIIDPDETVRMEVAMAVGRSGKTALSEYLFEMLLDESDDVRRVALEVLSGFRADDAVREQLYRRLEYYPDDHLPTIIETLGRVDIVAALPRLRRLVGGPHGEDVRAAVVKAVGAAEEAEAAELLLTAVADTSPRVRAEALRGLGKFRTPLTYEALVRGVADADDYCAYAAVAALGEHADAAAVPVLEGVVRDPKADMGIRVEAVRALGKLQARESAGVLADLLASPDEDVRRESTKALSRLHGPEAFYGLARAAADPFWAVRAAAIAGLSAFGQQGLEYVLGALEDPESLVRKAAVRGLGSAGPALAMRLVPLLADDELEETVAPALEAFGEKALPYLQDAIAQPSPTLRLRLARVLGRIGGKRAGELLETLAADAVPEVAAVARKSIDEGEVE